MLPVGKLLTAALRVLERDKRCPAMAATLILCAIFGRRFGLVSGFARLALLLCMALVFLPPYLVLSNVLVLALGLVVYPVAWPTVLSLQERGAEETTEVTRCHRGCVPLVPLPPPRSMLTPPQAERISGDHAPVALLAPFDPVDELSMEMLRFAAQRHPEAVVLALVGPGGGGGVNAQQRRFLLQCAAEADPLLKGRVEAVVLRKGELEWRAGAAHGAAYLYRPIRSWRLDGGADTRHQHQVRCARAAAPADAARATADAARADAAAGAARATAPADSAKPRLSSPSSGRG